MPRGLEFSANSITWVFLFVIVGQIVQYYKQMHPRRLEQNHAHLSLSADPVRLALPQALRPNT